MGPERLVPKPKRRRVRQQLDESTDLSSDEGLSLDASLRKIAPVSQTTAAHDHCLHHQQHLFLHYQDGDVDGMSI
ncbi:hypothetical protein Y032_1108g3618 [Ancylostoma ceylanicum]|uniref:Uncharacterized protein n=1 Tax=Ancylostoma ceylanicum TaxID=53326 RepID=A0A016W7F0_9BILA|nr:hypothetical protein Y032_1108g3618 [Ancylostoma ceylanicum]